MVGRYKPGALRKKLNAEEAAGKSLRARIEAEADWTFTRTARKAGHVTEPPRVKDHTPPPVRPAEKRPLSLEERQALMQALLDSVPRRIWAATVKTI